MKTDMIKTGVFFAALVLTVGAAHSQTRGWSEGEAPPSAPPAPAIAAPPPPPPAIAPLAASPYQGMPLASVTYTMPSMTKTSAGKAMFGALGGLAMVGDGDKIVKAHNIADAAVAISARLTPLVAQRYQTSGTTALPNQDDNDRDKLAKAAGNQGLVVDVETRAWLVNYFAFDWGHYRLMYNARARLIDGKTGKEIERASCDFDTSDEPNPPDGDGVEADDAAWLKDRMTKAEDACVATLATKLLGG